MIAALNGVPSIEAQTDEMQTGEARTGERERPSRRRSALSEARFQPPKRPTSDIEQTPDAFRIKINTEPPTRDKLFRLATDDEVVSIMERDYREKDKTLAFIIPGTLDSFDNPDSDRLGINWAQKTRGDEQAAVKEQFGVMGVVNKMGQYPYTMRANVPPEAAVFIEPMINPDMEVGVDVNLGKSTNEFGVLLRANVPDAVTEARNIGQILDQLKVNSFYIVVATADRIELQRLTAGKPTRLQGVSVPPKQIFRLTATAYGDKISVLRDGQEVLTATDSALTGRHAGVVGLKAEGEPVRFDNFAARGYGGRFKTRLFAATLYKYHGPNVHYNPLYFEQRSLERYGQHLGNLAQPFIAHGLFVADLLLFPMSVGTTKPWECFSADLYARPGDVVPFQLTPPVFSAQGVALELAVVAAIAAGTP